MPTLATAVQYVKGIGPQRAADLAREGIQTVEDLLLYLPFRYEDRLSFRDIADLREGETAVVFGQVALADLHRTRRTGMSIFEVVIRDRSASLILKFFNQPFLKDVVHHGQWVVAYGQVKLDSFRPGRWSLFNPQFEILDDPEGANAHMGRVTPVYRRIGKLSGKLIRRVAWDLLQQRTEPLPSLVPKEVAGRLRLADRTEAVRSLHVPAEGFAAADRLLELNEFRSPFHHSLIFEEFFLFQTGLLIARERRVQRIKKRTLQITPPLRERLKKMLPFHPTEAQKRVLREIVDDLRTPHPMNRLLQGDVGSGKTIVAAETALIAVDNGWQVAVMAPTELLAEQHASTFARLLEPLGVRTALLSRGVPPARRSSLRKALHSGDLNVLIGTHALIQEPVQFSNLGLAIIDEQHRFGVMQRSALMEKGEHVDTLIMTATPIPRSLAMTLYGDLDVSVIDRMPPGRRPVRTLLVSDSDRESAYQLLEEQLRQGRQAYVVYPLIEESEKVDLRPVRKMAGELEGRFPSFKVGMLHGRLKGEEKQTLMAAFASGEVQILAATTVVEVGIDVPNATVMVVEHADRFGLSQLHQLRGRVGRGGEQSLCVLVTDPEASPESWERLAILEQSADGFAIAEKDLELRGPGEFAGTRQSGVPLFRHGNLARDIQIMRLARDEAARHLKGLKGAAREDYVAAMGQHWKDRFQLSRVG